MPARCQLFVQPFNSTNKYALCVVQPPGKMLPGKHLVFLKGAPEIVLERCDTWLCGGVEKSKASGRSVQQRGIQQVILGLVGS